MDRNEEEEESKYLKQPKPKMINHRKNSNWLWQKQVNEPLTKTTLFLFGNIAYLVRIVGSFATNFLFFLEAET